MDRRQLLKDAGIAGVSGGISAPEAKYRIGQKVCYYDKYDRLAVGMITGSTYFARGNYWAYSIDGSVGLTSEDQILRPWSPSQEIHTILP